MICLYSLATISLFYAMLQIFLGTAVVSYAAIFCVFMINIINSLSCFHDNGKIRIYWHACIHILGCASLTFLGEDLCLIEIAFRI